MALPIHRFASKGPDLLALNPHFAADWLVKFLVQEVKVRRKMDRVVIGLSGGLDSAVTTYLAVRALGAENVLCVRMPYKLSSQASLDDAQLVIDALGVPNRTIEITPMVDPYLSLYEPQANATRIGNVCARMRMIVLFDQSAEIGGISLGTGNKTERMFGYYTWHADDAPPVNPLGDLFKTQVYEIARALGVPEKIISKAPSADLAPGQTDEGDFGISYAEADRILSFHMHGWPKEKVVELGYDPAKVDLVWAKVNGTHWKRKLPTVAMMSTGAIGEYYLRPVDY